MSRKPILRPVRGFNVGNNFDPTNPSGCDAGWTYYFGPNFLSTDFDSSAEFIFTDPTVITQSLSGASPNLAYIWLGAMNASGFKAYMNYTFKVASAVSIGGFICYSGMGVFDSGASTASSMAAQGNIDGNGGWSLRTTSCSSGAHNFFIGRNNSSSYTHGCSGVTGTTYNGSIYITVGAKSGGLWPITCRYVVAGLFDQTKTRNVSLTSDQLKLHIGGYYQGNLDPSNTLMQVNQLYVVAQTKFASQCAGSTPFLSFRRDRSGPTYKKKGHLWLLG